VISSWAHGCCTGVARATASVVAPSTRPRKTSMGPLAVSRPTVGHPSVRRARGCSVPGSVVCHERDRRGAISPPLVPTRWLVSDAPAEDGSVTTLRRRRRSDKRRRRTDGQEEGPSVLPLRRSFQEGKRTSRTNHSFPGTVRGGRPAPHAHDSRPAVKALRHVCCCSANLLVLPAQ
jgi:hypothetical protein